MGRRCACAILTDVLDRREGGQLETDLSAQQPSPQADARVPGADAHPPWPGRALAAPQEGTPAPERLMAGGSRPPAVAGHGASERLLPAGRVRRRADFLRCYREGRRRQGRALALYFIPNGLGEPRIGVTASRKVGGAVERHQLKRWIREIYRRWAGRRRLPAIDIVVHLKPEA